ncbi:MAG: flagellar motor switch phosphatase FliY [Candidatus Riflebacteria bacterium]|nr:flagellar motor switch phosphatase FliY [Candidatus Riflebacteria bacterium]
MSDGVLSQEEINALLNGGIGGGDSSASEAAPAPEPAPVPPAAPPPSGAGPTTKFTQEDINQLTEVAKLALGATSSVVQMFVNQQNAEIALEQVRVVSYSDLVQECASDEYLILKIAYIEGFDGLTYLVLKKPTVAIIGDLAMGGSGLNVEFQEMHISACQEMLNQMMGKTTTSLAEIFKKRVDISPPTPEMVNFSKGAPADMPDFHEGADFLRIGYNLKLGDVATTEMLQLYPAEFALLMAHELNKPAKEPPKAQVPPPPPPGAGMPPMMDNMAQQPIPGQMPGMMPGQMPGMPMPGQMPNMFQGAPAEFNMLQMPGGVGLQSNIDLLLDVPLEITVELGRTRMLIKDVLELGIGSVVELNKLAGESVEVFVNNKLIAKGEVVVIDENFAVRITNIINPQDRLQAL